MHKLIATLIALTLVLSAGVVHGLWTERWRPAPALEDAAARVARVPLRLGDWTGTEAASDPEAFAMAGARGYWTRSYVNGRTGQSVLVILMCGRAGRMSVHTPEVCYQGAGYDLFEPPAARAIRAPDGREFGSFWTAVFAKAAAPRTELRLFWAWTDDGAWRAPASPRWEFRGRPVLYKLYVAQDGRPPGDHGPAPDFLWQALPELNRVLFEPEPGPPSAGSPAPADRGPP
jgi:hypothetical protein